MWERVLAGFVRAVLFCRFVIPIIVAYKWKQLTNKLIGRDVPEDEWEAMHATYAPRCLEIAQSMQGFYIKIGQHLATTGPHFMPPIYVDYLTTLLENCPSQPFGVVEAIVEVELGPLARTFESFSEKPMNAASTGQVHSAKLIGGHEVVVKVQHPEAEWTFGVDLCLFVWTLQAFALPGVELMKQIQENLVSEFDFQREAAQQREAAEHLADFPNIVVPLPVDRFHPQTPTTGGLCTKRVLVMDKLFGTSLADWGRSQLETEARNQGKTRKELQDELMSKPVEELESMRPSAVFLAACFMAVRAGDLACNTPLFAYNWGLGYALGRPVEYHDTPLPPNIHHITDELLAAQGHMIFRAGFVNADPHAGNVMLLTDGRIALIDWGQVVRLTQEQRCLLAGLYIAVADGDDPMSAHCMRTLGGRTLKDWDWTQAQWAKITCWSLKELEENDWQRVSEVMIQVDPTTAESDSAFVMTFKNQLYTRQVAALLGFPGTNSAVTLRGHAEECLRAAGWPVPKTSFHFLPRPPEVQELLLSNAALQGRENGTAVHAVAEKAVPARPRKALFIDSAAIVLVAYGIGMAVKNAQAPPALEGAALLATPVIAAVIMGPALQVHLGGCTGEAAACDVGAASGGSFDIGGWELNCGSSQEGACAHALASAGTLWWPAAPLPLPVAGRWQLVLAAGLLPAPLICLAVDPRLWGLPGLPLFFVLACNSGLVLHLARKAAARGPSPSPDTVSAAVFCLALVTIYAVQYCTVAAALV